MRSQIHSPAATVNMVFLLPREFKATSEEGSDEEEIAARLLLDPERAIFEKPEESKHRHLKALYLNGFVNGKPMSKMLVDGGAAVNVMPIATF